MISANLSGFDAAAVFNQAIQYGTSGNADGKAEYVGFAVPGTARAYAGWLIKKLTYDSSGRVTDVQVALSTGENYFSHAFVTPQNLSYS